MPKMKTHRGAAKRMRRTGTGKVLRHKAFHSHLLEHKSPKQKRRLAKAVVTSSAHAGHLKRLLPNG